VHSVIVPIYEFSLKRKPSDPVVHLDAESTCPDGTPRRTPRPRSGQAGVRRDADHEAPRVTKNR